MKVQVPSLPALSSIVMLNGDTPTTTSLIIAEQFEKRHDDVLRAIRKLECSVEFNARNFAAVKYRDAKGQFRQAFQITRDGFMFLGMGFSGAKAAALKERFIGAFNALEQHALGDHQRELFALRAAVLHANPTMARVARYCALGLGTWEIARILNYTPQTIRNYKARMRPLGLLPVQPQQLALSLGGAQ